MPKSRSDEGSAHAGQPPPDAGRWRVDGFLDELRVARRLAANTLESYGRDLEALLRHAASRNTPVETLTQADLEALVRERMAAGLAPRSVARLVASIRGFYRFLVRDGQIRRDPAGDLHAPRAWPALPKCLSLEDVDRLIEQPDTATPLGVRDRALIELLYATGMRVSELLAVRPADINLAGGYLVCEGKGGKERLVPVGAQAVAWIGRYLEHGRPRLVKRRACEWLFVNIPRRAPRPRRVLEDPEEARACGGTPARSQPARHSPFLRHAPAGARRRPALHPEPAGPRRPVDDADLHARRRGPPEGGVRAVPPASLNGSRPPPR